MKPDITMLAIGGLLLASPAFAQDAAAGPASWWDIGTGMGAAIVSYLKGPAVMAFIMAQARAMFPWLGNLGILTVVGDVIAGNWGHAKNSK